MDNVKIKKALISVYNKEGLEEVVRTLAKYGVELISTGGTHAFITELGLPCVAVEDITNYPSIFGGRVKTLHPAIFGAILARREQEGDRHQCEIYGIEPVDLVVIDLYPFVQTVQEGGTPEEIIEKIDIGGVSLIRAAAKNFEDVMLVPDRRHYAKLVEMIEQNGACTTRTERRKAAQEGFRVTAAYDAAILRYFSGEAVAPTEEEGLSLSYPTGLQLRYGENSHQKGYFYGDLESRFEYLQGKELSYNNLLDVDAAVHLMEELPERPACAILKHNTPCGLAVRETIEEAYDAALACDPVSAFGGIIVLNRPLTSTTLAERIDETFFEVLIAPAYSEEVRSLLAKKQKRIILVDKIGHDDTPLTYRTALGGLLVQERDRHVDSAEGPCFEVVTDAKPSSEEIRDLLFGMKAVKYCKSNAIVLAKGEQICGAGYGQTSRVDALRQAIDKAHTVGLSLEGAVMASDGFFPFADCVELAHQAGITAIIQPGGSIKDALSTDYCNTHGIAMVHTGIRHFRH